MGKRIQKLALKNLASKVLNLGYVGENEHTQIIIDCSEVLWDYSEAVASVVVQPPRGDMYPVEVTRDGDNITWEIADSDLIYSGTGRVQITFTNNGEIVKSAIGNTRIEASIMATGPVPTPLENWMEQAEETARQMAQEAADATVEDLAEEKEVAIAEIQQAAEDARETIPADYTQLSDDVSDLKSAIATKVEEDGYYEELTAGSAEQLISTEAVTDTTPYLYRKSGGSADVGNRETLEKIVGGTVAWNQLIPTTAESKTVEGVTFTNNGDGSWTVNGTASGNNAVIIVVTAPKSINDHVVYLRGCPADGGNGKYRLYINGFSTGVDTGNGAIGKPTGLAYPHVFMQVYNGYTVENQVWKLQLFDLTAMFGPTIADYIYNLEQANAGAGIAWFRKLFPKDYYPYNPGELISVKTSSHDMVGFNAWDEEWELGYIKTDDGQNDRSSTNIRSKNYIPVIPGESYYVSTGNNTQRKGLKIFYYSADKTYISCEAGYLYGTIFANPSDSYYIRFFRNVQGGNAYDNDICINLSHSGSRNGEYEPYEKHSYPLADVELRGLLAIDDGKLVYSGDEYTPSGQVKRKYRLINLGEPNWSLYSGYSNLFYVNMSDVKGSINNTTIADFICLKYTKCPAQFIGSDGYTNGFIAIDMSGRIYVNDTNYSDAAAFKTAMDGVYLLYELATPTTEEAAPYTPLQVVDDWGTEEFVDTREVAIPVGHSTSYMANLRDKLQHLPSLAEEDGEYIVKQTGTKMELSKLSSSGLAQSIYESIESAPVVSFADGADDQPMKAVKVAIEPVQDLHGYDSPWPAGGGKNIFDGEIEVGALSPDTGNKVANNDRYRSANFIPVKPSTRYRISVDGTATSANIYSYDSNKAYLPNVDRPYSNDFTTSADTYYIMIFGTSSLNSSKVQIEEGSSVTAWSPYSNICPISGWTGAKVTRTGKNLLDDTTIETGYYDADGNAVAESIMRRTASYIPVGNEKTLYVNITPSSAAKLRVHEYNAQKTWIRQVYVSDTLTGQTNFEVPLSNDAAYVRFSVPQYTSLAFYVGQTFPVSWQTEAGTVYGGTLDVASGKLVVDRAMVDLGTLVWSYTDQFCSTESLAQLAKLPASNTERANLVCSVYGLRALWDDNFAVSNSVIAMTGTGQVRIRDARITDQQSIAAAVSGQTIVYELATPLAPIQLDPTEIKTLLGVNNIWSDAGDTAVTYPADTKLYIDKKIAELQALILENNG